MARCGRANSTADAASLAASSSRCTRPTCTLVAPSQRSWVVAPVHVEVRDPGTRVHVQEVAVFRDGTLGCDARYRTKRSQVARSRLGDGPSDPSKIPRIHRWCYEAGEAGGGSGRYRSPVSPDLARKVSAASPTLRGRTRAITVLTVPFPVVRQEAQRASRRARRGRRDGGGARRAAAARCVRWSPSDDRRTRRSAERNTYRLVVPRRLLQHTRRSPIRPTSRGSTDVSPRRLRDDRSEPRDRKRETHEGDPRNRDGTTRGAC